jgi:cellulose synthase/poly-beta-1,6-N-acetylglucosamine synthase-like glycosyltransferase
MLFASPVIALAVDFSDRSTSQRAPFKTDDYAVTVTNLVKMPSVVTACHPSHRPSVSVLMPVYNASRYVTEAIDSILAQTFTDFEFLIINDGSTDESLALLQEFAQRDERIHLHSRANTGYLVALNEMLERARGGFIARMDADDVAMPSRLEQQVRHLNEHAECGVVGSRVLLIDTDGDPICTWNDETTHTEIDAIHMNGRSGSAICHPSAMMRRDIVMKVGCYREAFYFAEDLDLFLRIAEHVRIANLPDTLLKYRMDMNSICHARKDQQNHAINAAIREAHIRRHLPPPATLPFGKNSESHSVADQHRKWAWWALSAGNKKTARKHARTAVRVAPWSTDSWKVVACSLRGY